MSLPKNESLMKAALEMARRGFGRTAPNPSVGCIVASINGETIYAAAHTAQGGRPHAEEIALARAANQTHGSMVAVTLEPCIHEGRGDSSCAELLVAAGVKKVLIALQDDDKRTRGRGVAYLREHDIEVIEHVCESEARIVHGSHIMRHGMKNPRPWVTLKTALSLDGKMAAADGSSQWITKMGARRYGRFLRCRHDAIMVGAGTLERDNPMLTTRMAGLPHPIRIVMGGTEEIVQSSQLMNSVEDADIWWVTAKKKSSLAPPITLIEKSDLPSVLASLSERGITRLLVEGGATLASSFLREQCVDGWVVMRGEQCLGGDGVDLELPIPSMAEAHDFQRVGVRLGEEMMMEFYRPHTHTHSHAMSEPCDHHFLAL